MKLKHLIFIFCFLSMGCTRNPKEPGYEFMPDMVHAVPYEAFSHNPNTSDHKTLQLPPEGSIPRGFMPYHYGNTPEEAARAGREVVSPLETNEKNLARGKKVFETYCLVCHGEQGKGDGPLIPKFPSPPSFKVQPVKDYPAGRIYHVVTKGTGLMASYASQITQEDRWKLVQYVQTLQKSGGAQ
ncbi:MAG: cytochrome c [Deltaproteobacteria bacterium]|nr:MAG: cytochrome c [Deltaproteobacteria bacterium]